MSGRAKHKHGKKQHQSPDQSANEVKEGVQGDVTENPEEDAEAPPPEDGSSERTAKTQDGTNQTSRKGDVQSPKGSPGPPGRKDETQDDEELKEKRGVKAPEITPKAKVSDIPAKNPQKDVRASADTPAAREEEDPPQRTKKVSGNTQKAGFTTNPSTSQETDFIQESSRRAGETSAPREADMSGTEKNPVSGPIARVTSALSLSNLEMVMMNYEVNPSSSSPHAKGSFMMPVFCLPTSQPQPAETEKQNENSSKKKSMALSLGGTFLAVLGIINVGLGLYDYHFNRQNNSTWGWPFHIVAGSFVTIAGTGVAIYSCNLRHFNAIKTVVACLLTVNLPPFLLVIMQAVGSKVQITFIDKLINDTLSGNLDVSGAGYGLSIFEVIVFLLLLGVLIFEEFKRRSPTSRPRQTPQRQDPTQDSQA